MGASAATNASGQFSLYFTCPAASTLMYVTASGGHIGSGAANSAIQLVSALGPCGSLPASIVVNELTSTAAAYALSGFASVGTMSIQGKSPGINQAFVTLNNLINANTGTFATTGRENNPSVVQQRLDTVANAMAACVSSSTGACAELFSCARANTAFASTGQPCTGGTTPATTDTQSAALAVVQNAGLVSMSGIFDVATSNGSPFTPALAAAPLEWTLPLVFTIKNYGPLAIDAGGHVWLLAPDPNPPAPPATPNLAVTEIDADGTFISPHKSGHDWSQGGVATIQGNDTTNLAIDQSGNVWVKGTAPTVAELNSAGSGVLGAPFVAGSGPINTSAVTIDSAGNAWFASGASQPIFELSQTGVSKSPLAGYAPLNCPCNGMAADATGNVWTVSNGPAQFLSRLNALGTESSIIAPTSGAIYKGVPINGGLAQFFDIATDGAGDLWITDKHYYGVWKFTPSGPGGVFSATPFSNNASPGTIPKGIAIDGAGHKWVANNVYPNPSITELSVDGSTNLSPSGGFGFQVNSNVMGSYGIAIDGSGNVWVTDGATGVGSGAVTEYVGAAAPTKNPIVTAVTSGSFSP